MLRYVEAGYYDSIDIGVLFQVLFDVDDCALGVHFDALRVNHKLKPH
jgi:hypothetical protein